MENNVKTKNKFLATLISTIMILTLIPAITTPATAIDENSISNIITEIHVTFDEPSVGEQIIGQSRVNIKEEDKEMYYVFMEEWSCIDKNNHLCDITTEEFQTGEKYTVLIVFLRLGNWQFSTDEGKEVEIVINGKAYDLIADWYGNLAAAVWVTFEFGTDPYFVEAKVDAVVNTLKGNQNELKITITEHYSDGTTIDIVKTFTIANNAAGTYNVGDYTVFVNTKGNTQIRECYIVE